MPWPVHPTGFFGARGDSDTYRIERSLRFNSADSAYLNRTPASAGNRKTWTWSGWVKRGTTGSQDDLFAGYIGSGTTDNQYFNLFFDSSNSLRASGYSTSYLTTTQVFRDPSSWYHILCVVDTTSPTANNRIRFYINGTEITSFSTRNNPSLNNDLGINQASQHQIGQNLFGSYFDGYLAEINFIDGQALTPSSFGETDAITGRWKAKAYSGTYGTNGFYLKFADNSGTTATTLGKDSSGNGNNWTPNNFSVTAGAGNDSLVDSPTNYGSDTGLGGEVRGNYATLSPLETFSPSNLASLGNGLLEASISAGANAYYSAVSTQAMTRGKWYWEVLASSISGSAGTWMEIGIMPSSYDFPASNPVGAFFLGYSYTNDALKANNGSYSSYGSTWTSNDVIGIAFDCDNSKITFYKNGVSQGDAFTGIGSISQEGYYAAISIYRSTAQSQSAVFNFGQRPFAYTAPSGFKALCTQNLPQPTIQKPSRYMDALAYTGTGASNSISSLGFSPDLVWIKNRGTTTSHAIYDTIRGAQSQLSSDTTGDQVTSSSGLTSFDANGFTIGTSTLVNTSGTQYVAWGWDESVQAGMDIVSYTGNGANRTISHNLGVVPKMIIVKARTTAGADQGWPVWHTSIANTTYLTLSTTSATATGTDYWNSTSPTSSVFSLGTNVAVNANNDTYISYLFAEIEGYSKFGSYTGNGSSDGPFVYCGFRPRWVMVKRTDAAGPWQIFDTARNLQNSLDLIVYPYLSNAEASYGAGDGIDAISCGYKIRETSTDLNPSGGTFIFAAFAEAPFKYARAR